MRTVIIICELPDQQWQKINCALDLIQNIDIVIEHLEIWIFSAQNQPEFMPDWQTMLPPKASSRLKKIVWIAMDDPFLPENIWSMLIPLTKQNPVAPDLYLVSSDSLGQEIATRLAYKLGGSSMINAVDCAHKQTHLLVSKNIYNSNATGLLALTHWPICISPAPRPAPQMHFSPAKDYKSILNVLEKTHSTSSNITGKHRIVGIHRQASAAHLEHARKVLILGNGVRSQQDVTKILSMAQDMDFTVGSSRPLVMKGWMPMQSLVGASGHQLAADICIAAGISGSAVFTWGIQNCRKIIAINTDPQAPLFRIAHAGLVADLMETITEMHRQWPS